MKPKLSQRARAMAPGDPRQPAASDTPSVDPRQPAVSDMPMPKLGRLTPAAAARIGAKADKLMRRK